MPKGIVYIVKNPAFPHLVKIGYTCRDSVKDRGLDSSNVPEDYEVLYAYTCNNPQQVERHMHELFKQYRHVTMTGRQTEFFYIICAPLAKEHLDLLTGASNVTTSFQVTAESSQQSDKLDTSVPSLYDEAYHLNGKPEKMITLYQGLKNAILDINPNITVKFRKFYLSFKLGKKTISDIEIQNKQLKVYVNAKKGTLEDPEHITRDISSTGSWGNGDYQICISDNKHIPYIINLIKQII